MQTSPKPKPKPEPEVLRNDCEYCKLTLPIAAFNPQDPRLCANCRDITDQSEAEIFAGYNQKLARRQENILLKDAEFIKRVSPCYGYRLKTASNLICLKCKERKKGMRFRFFKRGILTFTAGGTSPFP